MGGNSDKTTYIANPERVFSLSKEKNNFPSLTALFAVKPSEHYGFPCLRQAIDQMNFDFYEDLLPKIAEWASDHSQSKSVQPLQSGKNANLVYTAAQIRYILANAFFLNTSTSGNGTIDLMRLYNSHSDSVGTARVRCLLEYFDLSSREKDLDREIRIERYSYGKEVPDWSAQKVLIDPAKINVFTGRMEEAKEAEGFVDFANKRIHIHSIIPSATQEEVLFSCCPEAFLAILTCETLASDEVVILRGCKRYVDYTGYLYSFAYQGHYAEQNPSFIQDLLVVDACFCEHFSRKNIDGDLGKAWAAFAKSGNRRIVTGNWGCGAFGGDFLFKFLQQVCAAMVLGDQLQGLDYSVYGDEQLATRLKTALQSLAEKQKTVAEIYQMMINYRQFDELPAKRMKFSDYFQQWINSV